MAMCQQSSGQIHPFGSSCGICQAQACEFDGDLGLFSMTILSTFQFDLAQG